MPSSSSSESYGVTPDIQFIGSDLGNPNNLKWRGIAESGGKLYATPYIDSKVIAIDPSDDSVGRTGADLGSGYQKYVDSLTASNGKIYANPHSSFNYLEVDGTGSTPVLTARPSSSLSHTNIRGGAEANGHIYGSIYSRNVTNYPSPFFSKFSLTAFTQTLHGITIPTDSSGNRTGGIYDYRTNWQSELEPDLKWMYDSYYGSTKAPNGKVYLTPYGADRIAIIDPSDDSVSLGSDILTGNEPYYTGSYHRNIWLNHAYWNKYSGGTYAPSNGCIYCFPRHGNAILKIDPSDDSATEIQLPSALRIAKTTYTYDPNNPITVHKNKSFSSVLGPNGIIYSVPYEIPYIFWIDPVTDQIGYKDISTDLVNAGSASHSWYSYGVTYGDYIYMAPQMASYVIKIGFPPVSSGSAKSYSSVSEGEGNP
jgi:hypothetical protein